jgi:L-ascorbate metabolism protein UlaG (beta-lactamase superfamily)
LSKFFIKIFTSALLITLTVALFVTEKGNELMKSWEQIKNEAQRGDWERVAEIAGCSRKLVELVARGERKDHYKLQEIFTQLIESRESLVKKYRKTKQAA